VVELVALARGFLDLAMADEARASGRLDAAQGALSAARRRVQRAGEARDGERPLRECSDDIRAMARVLATLIEGRALRNS
jgi:hypothetical protein